MPPPLLLLPLLLLPAFKLAMLLQLWVNG